MKKTGTVLLLSLAPAILAAQSATATTTTTAQADIPSSYSAQSRASLTATFNAARQRDLPEQPIRDRIAEGRAKGASEGQVVLAAHRAEARMEAAQSAMVRAGRRPTDAEVSRSEHAMARGATEVQVEAIARRTPPERSLEVALEVLTELQARGVSTERAVAQITSRLEARASDAAIRELAVNANANAGVNAAVAAPNAGANASATGAAAASATGAGAVVAGGAKAGVGIIKPPAE